MSGRHDANLNFSTADGTSMGVLAAQYFNSLRANGVPATDAQALTAQFINSHITATAMANVMAMQGFRNYPGSGGMPREGG